ncbi:MAG: Type II restriction enzyme MunI [bacterium ADurb.Bin157]|nr:MAG: Type II restriction enzyme MunI [bacterium ADurb.Bin157]
MGSDANRLRKKWQDYSGKNAGNAENDFFTTFKIFFEDTEYVIRPKPKESGGPICWSSFCDL